MTTVYFSHPDADPIAVECDPHTTLLEGLLAAGIKIPNSCRAGLCQACLCESTHEFRAGGQAQEGLSEQQKRNNQFLSCQCYPAEPMSVKLPSHTNDWLCELVGKRFLSDCVVELSFKAEGQWLPGQHLLLWMNDVDARPYTASSVCDQEGVIRFVIERHSDGAVSRWCYDQLAVGDKVRMSSPQGHFCLAGEDTRDLVFIAEGSGIGAAGGILQAARRSNPDVQADLFFVHSEHSYCKAPLEDAGSNEAFPGALLESLLASPSVALHQAIGHSSQASSINYDAFKAVFKSKCSSLRGKKVFIVGSPSFVSEFNKICFFAGAARNDILVEQFVTNEKTV